MRVRRWLLPGCVMAAAAGLLLLLTFGVAAHDDTSSIDSRVAHGHFPVVPRYAVALPVLGQRRSLSLQAFRGKVVVLNIYASWCPDCGAEAKVLTGVQSGSTSRSATVVGMTYEDAAPSTQSFDRHHRITYPVLRDVSGSMVRALGTYAVPETFVLDRQGRIVALRRGPITTAWLRQAMSAAERTA